MYDDFCKESAILSWTGDQGFKLYDTMDWESLGKDKGKWKDVLDAFEYRIQPSQTTMQSWYQLGNLYSNQFSNQTEFRSKIRELTDESGLTSKEELIKFLFITHNTNAKVREYLIDKRDPTKSANDFLTLARTIESVTLTENIAKKILDQVGKPTQIASVGSKPRRRPGIPGRSMGSSSTTRVCGRWGKRHPRNKCPAYNNKCKLCKRKGHFYKQCRTKKDNLGRKDQPRQSKRDQAEVRYNVPPQFWLPV